MFPKHLDLSAKSFTKYKLSDISMNPNDSTFLLIYGLVNPEAAV
jgi:hypothetical protein